MTRESRPRGAALTDSLPKRANQNGNGQSVGRNTSYGLAALDSEVARLRADLTREGFLRSASRMGQLVAGGQLTADRVSARLLPVGHTLRHFDGIPYSAGEIHRLVRDGLRLGGRDPRGPGVSLLLTNRADAREAILRWQTGARAHPWSRGRAATVRKIIDALAGHALVVGAVDIRLSAREVAELAGISRQTAALYLRRDLSGWVTIRRGKRGKRPRLRLIVGRAEADSPAEAGASASGLSDCARTGDRFVGASHDLWYRWSSGRETYRALDPHDAQPAADISRLAAVHVGTARRNLRRLEAIGLARRDPDGRWVSAEPAEVPASYPHGAERQLRHDQERTIYRASVASRRVAARSPAVGTDPAGDAPLGSPCDATVGGGPVPVRSEGQ